MKRTLPRSAAAFLAILGLLFAQLAVSAYACPGPEALPLAAPMQDMPGCDMAPAERSQSPLCQAHCLQGDTSLQNSSTAPVTIAGPCAAPALVPAPFPLAAAGLRPDRQGSLLERPTGPPIAVLHCRFLL